MGQSKKPRPRKSAATKGWMVLAPVPLQTVCPIRQDDVDKIKKMVNDAALSSKF